LKLDEDGNILDGHHRIRAWRELRSEGVRIPDYPRIVRAGMSELEKRSHVRAIHMLRRHLTSEQKRKLVEDQLKDTPGVSDRQIAKAFGVGHPMVGRIQRKLVQTGDVEQCSTSIDTLGRQQPRTRTTTSIFVKDRREEYRAIEAISKATELPERNVDLKRMER